ncbi:hypothetical protein D3C76_496060 [compost metagenome]
MSLGQRNPGVSVRMTLLSSLIRCWDLVTPASLPVRAMMRPARVLIRVDLPTLGMPMIMARTPRRSKLRSGSISWHRVSSALIFSGSCWVRGNALIPFSCSMCATHSSVIAGSARSALFSTLMTGVSPRSSGTRGFSLEKGMRASSISMMTSTWGMTSAISLRALCMWPGNQLMDISVTLSLGMRAPAGGCGRLVMRQTAGTHRKGAHFTCCGPDLTGHCGNGRARQRRRCHHDRPGQKARQ